MNSKSDSLKQFFGWIVALFLIVFGAKLWVIQLYGSPLLLWDQWYEAGSFFKPWLAGRLTFFDFFAPYCEHRIFFTRLLDLSLIELNGRCEPLLQMTVNAFIHSLYVCGLAFCLWEFLGRKNAWLICFILAPFFALPYAGENTIWAFNSQQYFLGILSLVTLAGLGFGKSGSWRWWVGLVAAIMSLFTMASGLLAAMAVGGLCFLRMIKSRRFEKENLLTLFFCLLVIGLGASLNVSMEGDYFLRAHTFSEFTSALTRNLTWPFFDAPGMACLIALPLAILVALYFRPDFQKPRAAEFLLAFALWSILQSMALAYGRANFGETIPASRYMDALNIFVVASVIAAFSIPEMLKEGEWPKWAKTLLPLVFFCIIILGLVRISNIVVDNLLISYRMSNLIAEERVETFMTTGDEDELFERPTVRPDPKVVLGVLRDEKLQTILPAACLAPTASHEVGHLIPFSRWLMKHSVAILFCGLILFNFFCGYGLIKGGMGLARENLIGVIAFLTGLMTLGFVLSKRSINRESVEYGLQQSLAAYFKSHNDLKRAAIHEHKAKTFNLDRGL